MGGISRSQSGMKRYRWFLFWGILGETVSMVLCPKPQFPFCNYFFELVMTLSPWLYQLKEGSDIISVFAPGCNTSLLCLLNLNPACTFVRVSSLDFLQSLFLRVPSFPSHTWTLFSVPLLGTDTSIRCAPAVIKTATATAVHALRYAGNRITFL